MGIEKLMKSKKTIGLAVLALLIISVILYFVFKKDEGDLPNTIDPPNGGNGNPVGWNPDTVVQNLKAAIDGIGIGDGYDINAELTVFTSLTDDQVATVYNRWDQTVKGTGNWPFKWKNLYKSIENESCNSFGVGPWLNCQLQTDALFRIEEIIY